MIELDDSVQIDSGEIIPALLASFEMLADGERSGLQLLAVAVALDPGEFVSLWSRAGPDVPFDPDVLRRLESSPLVERLGGRLRVIEPLGVVLAQQFAESDAPAFGRAHDVLTEIEQQRESEFEKADPHGEQLWQTKSLVAYYLMRSAPDDASSRFIETFDDAPLNDRRACRLWLAALSDRYVEIAQVQPRISRFFVAFRNYMSGTQDVAEGQFAALVDELDTDRVAAIAMHLQALCLRVGSPERRALLESSVRLSDSLGLNENLVMSRNSLVFEDLRDGRKPNQRHRLTDARQLAVANDHFADALSAPVYQAATRYARAVTMLEEADIVEQVLEPERGKIEERLDEAQAFALATHDLAAWLRPGLVRVDLLHRLGLVEEAVDALATAVAEVVRSQAIPELPRRQFERQVENLQAAVADDRAQTERLHELDQRFRRRLRRRA